MGVINIIDKLWKYLSGYAIISIEGFNKMKLINKAVKKFIKFSDITSNRVKATAIIPIEDLKKLYELNEGYKCSIKIEKINFDIFISLFFSLLSYGNFSPFCLKKVYTFLCTS